MLLAGAVAGGRRTEASPSRRALWRGRLPTGRDAIHDPLHDARRRSEERGPVAPAPLREAETLLRIRLPDRPGSLALVTGRLASYGVDIVRLEVVAREPGSVIDDLVVRGGDAVKALEELQPRVELLAAARSPAAEDPGLAMAEACHRLATADHLDALRAELVGAGIRLAHAAEGLLLQPLADGRLRPLGATDGDLDPVAPGALPLIDEAVSTRRPVVARCDDERFSDGPALALPVCDPPLLVLLLVRRQRLPFLDVELRRVEALVALAGRLLVSHGELSVVR